MAEVQKISTGYQARPLMARLHMVRKRFKVYVLHRRCGKTVGSINELIHKAMLNTLNRPQYAYIAPTFTQAKRVAWEYFKEYTACFPGRKIHEGELRIDIPRPTSTNPNDFIRFYILGADNPDSIRGMYFDGVIMDEYAEMNPVIWTQVVRQALSDRNGWAIFIGTPKGSNHFKDVYDYATSGQDPEWYGCLYPASVTGIVPRTELESARRTMAQEEYDQEYECSFAAALIGAYFGKEMEACANDGRITSVPYDRSYPVDTWWDLGLDDSTAIWFTQQVGRWLHVIDYLEDNGKGIDHYIKVLLQDKPYVYREHNWPHDGAARDLMTGMERNVKARDLGLRPLQVHEKYDPVDTISAVRLVLPKCIFDKDRTHRGILALQNYERKWDAKEKIFMNKPRHNWASHGADAFRLFGMGYRDNLKRHDTKSLPRTAQSDYDYFAF